MRKRYDQEGRLLRMGESQRSDGRYSYRYRDSSGQLKIVYSNRLDWTDPTPYGRHSDLSLREKETQISACKQAGGANCANSYTISRLVIQYINTKGGIKPNTLHTYLTSYHMLQKDPFGQQRLDIVKMKDAQAWFIQLNRQGISYSKIVKLRSLLKPAFQMAVRDDLIQKNPFDFSLRGLIPNHSNKRIALTQEQENEYLAFVYASPTYSKYYDMILLLFRTGLRISECLGLTLSDIDFEKRFIHIDHQLYKDEHGKYTIQSPKSPSGVRSIPMTDEVYGCLKRIAQKEYPSHTPVIENKKDFLFLGQKNGLLCAEYVDGVMHRIYKQYSSIDRLNTPKVTPHICRHTFCTRMAERGINPKTLQYLMGHNSISVTLDFYTHFNLNQIQKEMNRVCEN